MYLGGKSQPQVKRNESGGGIFVTGELLSGFWPSYLAACFFPGGTLQAFTVHPTSPTETIKEHVQATSPALSLLPHCHLPPSTKVSFYEGSLYQVGHCHSLSFSSKHSW